MVGWERKRAAIILLLSFFVSGLAAWFGGVWMATFFGVVFSVFIPGFVLLLSMKQSVKIGWEGFLLSTGSGLAFLIFTVLAENWLLRSWGVAHPLSQGKLFLTTILTTLLTFGLCYRRWHEQPVEFKRPKIALGLDSAVVAYVILLLFCFIGGAIRLNNGAPGWLTVASYIGVALLIVPLLVLSQRLKSGTMIFALWLSALGIILSGWLRTNYAAGPDLDKEFQIFQLVKHAGYWGIGLNRNVYNACLSISILPVALSFFTKLPDILVFKLLMPTIYSLIVPVVFLIARSQLKIRATIIATFFFYSQPPFTVWWWVPVRQEVAFLFFGLLVLLFVTAKRQASTMMLLFLFGASMVVSHYSTSYIAIGLFLLYRLLQHLVTVLRRDLSSDVHLLKYTYILFLLLFTFLWYSQLTFGFKGVTQFATKSFQNIGSLFNADVQQQGQTPLAHLNIFSQPGSAPVTAAQYANTQIQQAQQHYKGSQLYQTNYDFQPSNYVIANSFLSQKLMTLRSLLKVLGNILVSFGIVIVGMLAWRRRQADKLGWLQVSSLVAFAVALFLPFFSVSYGEDRLYQQLLIIMTGATMAWINLPLLKNRWRITVEACLAAFAIIYFLALNQVLFQFTTSSQQSMALSNAGEQYLEYYIYDADVKAAQWLAQNRAPATPIFGDKFSQYRLATDTNLAMLNDFHIGVLPNVLPRNSYVYQTQTNTDTGTAFDTEGGVITYQFPSNFLHTQKNVIYTNQKDVIYR